MKGPMELIDAVLGVMQCQVCGARHGASRQIRYYAAAWQCSSKQCPTNQEYWDDRKKTSRQAGLGEAAGIGELLGTV